MKTIKNITMLCILTLFVATSCVTEESEPQFPLTQTAQSMYQVWLESSNDCMVTYLQVAQQMARYSTDTDSVKRLINRTYFPYMIITKADNVEIYTIYRSGETYFVVDLTGGSWRVSSSQAGYYQSYIDQVQRSTVVATITPTISAMYDITVESGSSINARYLVDENGAIVSGEGHFVVFNIPYDQYPVFETRNDYNDARFSNPTRLEYVITSDLQGSNGNYTAGSLSLKATSQSGEVETSSVEFFSEYALFTYKGISKRVYNF